MGKQKHDIGQQKRARAAALIHDAANRLNDAKYCNALAARLVRRGLASAAIIGSNTGAPAHTNRPNRRRQPAIAPTEG